MKFSINYHQNLDSTNKEAHKIAISGAPEGKIVVANSQNQGQGRLDRDWDSPPGNLYFSMILRPNMPFSQISQISFIAAISLKNAINDLFSNKNAPKTPIFVKNKWPNDILINDRKVAGILLESKNNGPKCDFVILGVGLNILKSPKSAKFPATNLSQFDLKCERDQILAQFLQNFEILYQKWQNFGFLAIKNLWTEGAWRLDQEISVDIGGQKINGVFQGLDEEGAMILNSETGQRKIRYGDVC